MCSVLCELALVLLIRRRIKSVPDVLKGIRKNGFFQGRRGALYGSCDAVCRQGSCEPFSVLGTVGSLDPPVLHGFHKWVSDALEVLNGSARQVVTSRLDAGLRCWASWLHEDLGAGPCHSLVTC